MLTTIIAVALVLGGLIFFHELGHFAVARRLGMGVSTFSLGFGPKIFTFKRGKTEYALSLVPLGGYVALVGESDESDLPDGFTKEESFALRPAWQRLLVIMAGPAANILLAGLVCWIMVFGWGKAVLQAEIGGLSPSGPAAVAGIIPGDRIISIDGQPVESWQGMSETITGSNGKTLRLEVARPDTAPGNVLGKDLGKDLDKTTDNAASPTNDAGTAGNAGALADHSSANAAEPVYSLIALELTPAQSQRKTIFGETETAWLIGVMPSGRVEMLPLGFGDAAVAGVEQAGQMLALTWQSFVKLVERVVPLDQVGGPIMIAQMISDQAHQGLPGLLALTALISINLGILNLLPIPVLDGGQIVFCLWEMTFRRPVNRMVQEYSMRVGVVLLVALMLLATYNDVLRIIRKVGGSS